MSPTLAFCLAVLCLALAAFWAFNAWVLFRARQELRELRLAAARQGNEMFLSRAAYVSFMEQLKEGLKQPYPEVDRMCELVSRYRAEGLSSLEALSKAMLQIELEDLAVKLSGQGHPVDEEPTA